MRKQETECPLPWMGAQSKPGFPRGHPISPCHLARMDGSPSPLELSTRDRKTERKRLLLSMCP